MSLDNFCVNNSPDDQSSKRTVNFKGRTIPERLVVALGGNALLRRGDHGTVAEQDIRSQAAMEALIPLFTDERQIVITHGNGPVVGQILLRQQLAQGRIPPMPIDLCDAASQGSIGAILERALRYSLQQHDIQRPVVTLLALVEVDPEDPAFAHPTKPIGPFLSEAEAQVLAVPTARDADRGFRRVVASPRPRHILERPAIEQLLAAGVITITLGGGGIPVTLDESGLLHGVEAVIDKDHSSGLLAHEIQATSLLLLTDIDSVYLNFLQSRQWSIRRMSVAKAEYYLRQGEFLQGSMEPKVRAGIEFLQGGGQHVLIGRPEDLPLLLQGEAGTEIVP